MTLGLPVYVETLKAAFTPPSKTVMERSLGALEEKTD